MNKKAKVKMLLDIISNLKSISTNAGGEIDMNRFYNNPEVNAVITLLRYIKADHEYLNKNGFVIADMLLGEQLTGQIKYKCSICGTENQHNYYGKDNHYCVDCGNERLITLSSTSK